MVIEMMIMKWQFRGIKSTWDETEEGQKEKKKRTLDEQRVIDYAVYCPVRLILEDEKVRVEDCALEVGVKYVRRTIDGQHDQWTSYDERNDPRRRYFHSNDRARPIPTLQYRDTE